MLFLYEKKILKENYKKNRNIKITLYNIVFLFITF